MWMIPIIVAASAAIFYVEASGLWKKKKIKDASVFSALLALGTGLAVVQALDIPIPNPLDAVRYIFEPAGEWINSMLK